MDKLIPYQQDHTKNLINIIKSNGRGLDASMMGLGKTYCAIVSCLMLNLKPFIVCPKIVMKGWLNVMEIFNCNYYGITSYELLQRLNYFNNNKKKINCDFITMENDEYVIDDRKIPNDVIIIYDEVHKCKNITTNNGRILHEFSKKNVKILMLSGTVAEQPIYFILIGLVLRLYETYDEGHNWIVKKSKLKDTNNYMLAFHKIIYPKYASKIDENIMKQLYPNCHIEGKCFEMKEQKEINDNYEELKKALENKKNTAITEYMRTNQKNELLKIPTIKEETLKEVKNGNSVVIFVNYTNTLLELSKQLNVKCLVYGEINETKKNKNIQDFNDDKERIIICNIKCGSNSISLHDLNGNHPRVSFIMPTWSVTDLVQALGRIYRANVKTKTRQYIVFSNCLNEIYIQDKIRDKLNNISLLNNGNKKNEPLFKIGNLLDKSKDIKTDFGNKQKITKKDKERLKNIMAIEKSKEHKKKIKIELKFKNQDYDSIMNLMHYYTKQKDEILKMDDNDEKNEKLEEINQYINEADILLQKSLDSIF